LFIPLVILISIINIYQTHLFACSPITSKILAINPVCGSVTAPSDGDGRASQRQELIQQRRVYALESLQRCRLSGCDPGTGRLLIHNTALKYNKNDRILDQESSVSGAGGMNREEAPGKSPEEMYIQQKVRVLLMLKKMGSNLTPNEEAFLRNYAGVVHSQMSQLPQHPIDQGAEDVVMAFSRSETEDRRQ
uniref:Beta-catenin-interacting protein 1 n=1 Tax=Cyprinus carpio TaxID=7962 RepID=A0A8C1JA30_CYPCA